MIVNEDVVKDRLRILISLNNISPCQHCATMEIVRSIIEDENE